VASNPYLPGLLLLGGRHQVYLVGRDTAIATAYRCAQ
jgi:hypothetical protein